MVMTSKASGQNRGLDSSAFKDLSQPARAISLDQRRKMIGELKDDELTQNVRSLFELMEPKYSIHTPVNRSDSTLDLLIIKKDSMTEDRIGVILKRGPIISKTIDDANMLSVWVNNALLAGVEKEKFSPQLNAQRSRRISVGQSTLSKVFVVLTEGISNRGRLILTKNSHGPVEVFDGDWLVQSFTDFYPQVFYEGRVTSFIQSQIQSLETKTWHNKESINLSDCFVEPVVRRMDI